MRRSGSARHHPDAAGARWLVAAAAVGGVHALVSLYWGLGGQWLLPTLGTRMLDRFAGLEWILIPISVLKAAVALGPVVAHRKHWPAARLTRTLCWLAAAALLLWGGANTVVGNLVLSGVLRPDGGYDRAGMIGHAWLWDPLFLLWGSALATGLVTTRRGRRRADSTRHVGTGRD